jgi:hypothetical protein
MISTQNFKQIEDDVVLVNTARSAVIDRTALVTALDSGTVAFVGLGVRVREGARHPMYVNPHVMLLPHVGTRTIKVTDDISWVFVAMNVLLPLIQVLSLLRSIPMPHAEDLKGLRQRLWSCLMIEARDSVNNFPYPILCGATKE